MAEKTPKIVVTFKSATDAVVMERTCRKQGIQGRTVPVPRSISASCGLCWISPVEVEDGLMETIQKNNLHYEETYYREMF